jgi:hypothetical protein
VWQDWLVFKIGVRCEVCAWHVSPSPPARCPRLSYVCRPRGKGVTGVLPPNMCSLQPWVCGRVGLSCGRRAPPHPAPTQGMRV